MPQPAVTDLEAKEPIESTDPNEPTEPIERMEPFEAMDRIDCSDRMDHRALLEATSVPSGSREHERSERAILSVSQGTVEAA